MTKTSLMSKVDTHLLLTCTNEVINLELSNLNHPTRLLLSLALQRCFSTEQIGKRPQMDKWDMYLYPPIQNITVEVQLSEY